MIVLKLCPFCGGEAKLEDMGWPHHVYCVACGAKVTSVEFGRSGEVECMKKWNKRIMCAAETQKEQND